MIEAANGKCLPAVDVFAMALKFLKDKAVEQIHKSSHLPNKKIQWIITVPTIWTDVAKDIMRQAARKVSVILVRGYMHTYVVMVCSYVR